MRAALPLLLTLAACSTNSNARPAAGPQFVATPVGTFVQPFAIAFLPDGKLLVTEKAGALKLRLVDRSVVQVGGVPPVAAGGQGGLLDVAVAPDFKSSGTIYLSYSGGTSSASELTLARARLNVHTVQCIRAPCPPQASLDGLNVIWRSGSAGKGGQFGGTIAFAPDGKSLFLASGERQRFTPAQDPDQALGKIVHLTLDGAPAPGNPMAGKLGSATVKVFNPPRNTVAAASATGQMVAARSPNTTPAETWSSGHRNPYGLTFDGGGRLWEVEMGPRGGDEVNLILPGRNYGWPLASNGSNYDGVDIPDHRAGDGFEPPKVFWNPSISPGGMIVYSGSMFPAWRGSMLVTALSGEALIRVALDGGNARKAEQWPMARLRDVAQAPDGSVWVIEDEGRLLRLTPPK